MNDSSDCIFYSTLKTTSWDEALGCLKEWFPSLDSVITNPSSLSAETIHDLYEKDYKEVLSWKTLNSNKALLSDPELLEITCRCDFSNSVQVYVVNDFTYAAKLGPFVVEGSKFIEWFKNYRQMVNPSRTPYDGDLIIWSSDCLYIFSHENVFISKFKR